MRHLSIITWLALSFFIDVSAFAETGRDYYMQGLDAYNNNLLMKAREYFEMACRAGYKDGCIRRTTMEKIISANSLSEDLASNASTSTQHSQNLSSTPNDLKKLFDEALTQYKAKNYSKSFPVFLKLCREENHSPSCLWLGRSYEFGHGTTKNIMTALDIFHENRENHEVFKIEEALLEEYGLGRYTNTRTAISIYNELQNSKVDWIAKEAKEGLKRGPIYSFLDRLFDYWGAFSHGRIKFDLLAENINNIDLQNLPPEVKIPFLHFRPVFLTGAKNKENSFMDGLLTIGKSAVKGFLFDLSFITDAMDEFGKSDGVKEFDLYWNPFVKSLQDEKISATFWNQQLNKIKK